MVELVVTGAVAVLALLAETLHARRVRRVARLAFGPGEQPAVWARWAGAARIASCAALAWGLTTLLLMEPKVHRGSDDRDGAPRHLILVLDVSPSMRLLDAGVEGDQSRMHRARDVLQSMFARMGSRQYLTTVVATYNGAIPVVEQSRDPEVVRNILNDLPLHQAFKRGDTDLFAGLEEAARIAQPWSPESATLIVVSDGDTIPATGMPKLPVSIGKKVVIGVGDPREGSFIDGRHSRQQASILRQLAIRLGGVYHDGNDKQVSSDVIRAIVSSGETAEVTQLSRREFALLAVAAGALVLSLLPLALQYLGTRWRPGVRKGSAESGSDSRNGSGGRAVHPVERGSSAVASTTV